MAKKKKPEKVPRARYETYEENPYLTGAYMNATQGYKLSESAEQELRALRAEDKLKTGSWEDVAALLYPLLSWPERERTNTPTQRPGFLNSRPVDSFDRFQPSPFAPRLRTPATSGGYTGPRLSPVTPGAHGGLPAGLLQPSPYGGLPAWLLQRPGVPRRKLPPPQGVPRTYIA